MSAHPLEQLRFLARSWDADEELPMTEVAAVLDQLATESPGSLLQACRRLIEYFPAAGPVWWLSARVLSAADPAEAVWQAADELSEDPTGRMFADALPPSVTVGLPGHSRAVALALRRRPDVTVEKKPGRADLVVVTALAGGPADLLVSARAEAAIGHAVKSGKPVWALVARGVLLPQGLWEQLLLRVQASGGCGVLSARTFSAGVSDSGKGAIDAVLSGPTCPAVAELLGWKS